MHVYSERNSRYKLDCELKRMQLFTILSNSLRYVNYSLFTIVYYTRLCTLLFLGVVALEYDCY